MKLIITCNKKDSQKEDFIINYLPIFTMSLFLRLIDKDRIKLIDQEFNINSYKILYQLFSKPQIYRYGSDHYIFTIGSNDLHIAKYLNMITNGNRQVRGYNIVKTVLTYIQDNIGLIYKRYQFGNSLL